MFGGISLILGLFTRVFAAAVAIEMLTIFFDLLAGYRLRLDEAWLRICTAVGFVSFAVALRGGGPYSLDRKLGKEL